MNKEELAGYCESELARLDSFAASIQTIATEGKTDFSAVEMAAMSAFVHYLYTSVENVIREILRFDGISEPEGEQAHQKLLKTAGELGIIPPDLFKPLSGLHAFRTAFVLGQTDTASWEEMKPLVSNIGDFRTHFRQEVREYLIVVGSE